MPPVLSLTLKPLSSFACLIIALLLPRLVPLLLPAIALPFACSAYRLAPHSLGARALLCSVVGSCCPFRLACVQLPDTASLLSTGIQTLRLKAGTIAAAATIAATAVWQKGKATRKSVQQTYSTSKHPATLASRGRIPSYIQKASREGNRQ